MLNRRDFVKTSFAFAVSLVLPEIIADTIPKAQNFINIPINQLPPGSIIEIVGSDNNNGIFRVIGKDGEGVEIQCIGNRKTA